MHYCFYATRYPSHNNLFLLQTGDRTDTGLEVTQKGALRIVNIRFSSTYVCMAINVVGATMTRYQMSSPNLYMIILPFCFRSYVFLNGEENTDFTLRNYGESTNGPQVQSLQVHGISSTSIKVSWKLTGKQLRSSRPGDSEDVDGFYILYRTTVGRPPGKDTDGK
jgi:hypothetical protein